MIRVFSSPSLVAVYHAKNLLEAAGMRCIVRNEALSSGLGELPFADCQPELWLIDDAWAERAGRVLAEAPHPPQTGALWQCVCGEIQEAQFTQCWHCGAFRPA